MSWFRQVSRHGERVGVGSPFKGRQFTAEVILWAVRWYLQFPIGYRDLECILADRGVVVDHTTACRMDGVRARDCPGPTAG